jgi:cleavage stimulation factor subunit 3
VFETTVNRLAQKPETIPKSKPLYLYFHNFEANYGELSQISKLEQRMQDLFPEDPQLRNFASRFTAQGFDPTSVRPIVSPATQAKPKMVMPNSTSLEQRQPSVLSSPRPSIIVPYQNTLSPKRPLDDSDTESVRPSKIARADSPLKGAAGRRLNAKNQTLLRNELHQQNGMTPIMPMHQLPPPLPQEVVRLLSMIPRADTYNATRFSADNIVNLLRTVDLTKATLNRPPATAIPQAGATYGYPPPSGKCPQ